MAEFNAEKARYIQNSNGITVSDTHLISSEGAKLYGYPTFWKNNGKGGHVDVVMFEGEYYLTQSTGTGTPPKGPVRYYKPRSKQPR